MSKEEAPEEYLESRKEQIIKRIEHLAEHGELSDAVKLKTNQILLNKILPDKQRLDIGQVKSPYELIMESIKEIENEKKE